MGKMNNGFTLIEMLVTVSLMAIFSLTLISVFLATIRGGTKSQLLQKLHQDGDFAIKSMADTIRQAESVDCSGDFSMTDGNGGITTFSLVTDNGVAKVASNSSSFLTGDETEASGLSFTCFDSNMGNQVVTIEFTLTAGNDPGSQAQEKYTQDFATSVSTRTY